VKIKKLFTVFTITILLANSVNYSLGSNVYADESSEKDKKEEKLEEKEKRQDEIKEKQNQVKEKSDDEKLKQKEIREENQNKLEEKKKLLSDFKKELKEKYLILKNKFKEKYAQLTISKNQDSLESFATNDNDETEIKLKELRLLEQEFREKIKDLKLEAKEHFSKLNDELKIQPDDRKNQIRDRINELKEKYKDQIKENIHQSSSDLEKYRIEYQNKKINICHIPPGNPDAAHTIRISVKAMQAHLAHGDLLGECGQQTDNDDTTQGKSFEITLSEKLGMGYKTN
jgi:DNA repair exonuclease SbcCD ATPase subunit